MKAKCKTKAALVKPERKNEIVVYQPDEVMRLEVRVLDESVWLTQAQIAELFGTKRPAITKHLANIYKTGELEKDGTCSILEHMGHDGSQQYRTTDNWVDIVMLELLSKKAKGVTVELVTTPRGNKLAASDIATFNAQYGGLTHSRR